MAKRVAVCPQTSSRAPLRTVQLTDARFFNAGLYAYTTGAIPMPASSGRASFADALSAPSGLLARDMASPHLKVGMARQLCAVVLVRRSASDLFSAYLRAHGRHSAGSISQHKRFCRLGCNLSRRSIFITSVLVLNIMRMRHVTHSRCGGRHDGNAACAALPLEQQFHFARCARN